MALCLNNNNQHIAHLPAFPNKPAPGDGGFGLRLANALVLGLAAERIKGFKVSAQPEVKGMPELSL